MVRRWPLHWRKSHGFTFHVTAVLSLLGLAVSHLARCCGWSSPPATSGDSGKTELSHWPVPVRGSRSRRPARPRHCRETSGWRRRRWRRRWSSSPGRWRWRWCCCSQTPDLNEDKRKTLKQQARVAWRSWTPSTYIIGICTSVVTHDECINIFLYNYSRHTHKHTHRQIELPLWHSAEGMTNR